MRREVSFTPLPRGVRLEDTDRIGVVTVHRFVDRDRTLTVSQGSFAPLLAAYRDHVARWELPTDGLAQTLMREGLAAFALHLAHRPPNETVGVTLNIMTPPMNLFLTGDAGEGTLTGRAFTDNVATADSSRMFVQSYRPEAGPSQSTIDVEGLDVLGMFEDYYARSEQVMARFFDLEEDERFLLVVALPDADPEAIARLTREGARTLVETGVEPLEERTFRFRCGCNPERIVTALREIFGNDPEELFRTEDAVETFCPRCGAQWWVTREDFDRPGK